MDDDGFIFLGYEAEMNDGSEFLWRKNYAEPTDSGRAREETRKNRYDCSRATRTVRLYLIEFQEICGSRHEQVIKTGSLSGDSLSVYPPVSLTLSLRA